MTEPPHRTPTMPKTDELALEWRADCHGRERTFLYFGPLPAGSIEPQDAPVKGWWTGWSAVLGNSEYGEGTGWFLTADEARLG